jgi:phosphate-selective porin OprO and OprP
MSRTLAGVGFLWLALAPATLRADEEQEPQDAAAAKVQEERKKKNQGLRFVFNRRPSIRWGDWLRVDFRLKTQSDIRTVKPDYPTREGLFELHRARVGIEGRVFNHFEYEVEREIREEVSDLLRIQKEIPAHTWRDVFVNFRYFRDAQIKVGKFKIPFGMDQTTGSMNLDFPYRSFIANYLAPARDKGIMVHGRIWERGLNYEAGVFLHDGENAEYQDVVSERGEERFKSGVRTFVGRVTGTPLRLTPVPKVFREVEIGGAFASTKVQEGLKSLRLQSELGENIFRHIFVHGHRLRLGTQLRWTPGPFSLKGEFIHVSEERLGQGIRGEDLPNLIERGWYLSGTWLVTGQKHDERDDPKRAFPPFGRGLGAVELAGRWEAMRLGSAEHPGRPARTPRAANVLGNSVRAWTFGVNWYWNRYMKIQLNGIRETIEDVQRTPVPGENRFWTRLVRIQFVM